MKSPHRDLALLVSVVGLGLATTARAESETEPVTAAEEGLQPSDWDWAPPEAVADVIVIAAPAAKAPAEPTVVDIAQDESLKPSDWDWMPGEVRGTVTAQAPQALEPQNRTYEPPAPRIYEGADYTVETIALDAVQRHFEREQQAAEEAALLAAVKAFAAGVAPGVAIEPAKVDRETLAAANDVDPRIASFVHDAMPQFDSPAAVAVVEQAPQAAAVAATLEAPQPTVTAVAQEVPQPAAASPNAVVVASHADKVLLGLFSLISDDWRVAGRPSLNPQDIVIGSTPTPLETLLVLPKLDEPNVVAVAPIGDAQATPVKKAKKPKKVVEPEPQVLVASHIDKVLLSLNAIRDEDAAPLALLQLQPKNVTVAPVPAAEPLAQATRDQPKDQPAEAASNIGHGWVALDSNRLDRVRGGFSDGNLQISFGIQRAVYINGALVTTTSLNMSSLGQVTGGTAGIPGSLALIQSGTGNSFFSMPTANGSVTTVIQNTLNNQKIQSVTEINAVVNSMQILKGMNLQQSLRSAVIDSLRR